MARKHFYKNEIVNICYKNHLSVDKIFYKLKKLYPKVGLSTVYRNVEELIIDNKLKQVKLKSKKKIYEANIGSHTHLIDVKTWKIQDIYFVNIDLDALPKWFEINSIELNVYWNYRDI